MDRLEPNVRECFDRWNLRIDGECVITPTSRLLPVRRGSQPLMLKIALVDEEKRGASLMTWWNAGAAPVVAHAGDALLMERATGGALLEEVSRNGDDDEASRIICRVARVIHVAAAQSPPALVPLPRWFAALERAAVRGGIVARAAATAGDLLRAPREVVPLHGDLHHGNVLWFGRRGWLAIDPKGLIGERGFDYANILRNPDLETATAPGRLARQATLIAGTSGVERTRLLQWGLAPAGLSAAWILEDGGEPTLDVAVAELAAAELDR